MNNSTKIYIEYLQRVCPNLNAETVQSITVTLENTNWDEPKSSMDFNNIAVIALVEAENCDDLSLRSLYLEVADESLSQGLESGESTLCLAHLSFLMSMTGQLQTAQNIALTAWINVLKMVDDNLSEDQFPPIIYLPNNKLYLDELSQFFEVIFNEKKCHNQYLAILSQCLCYSSLCFYNETGKRWLKVAVECFPKSIDLNVKLGIASIGGAFWEGLFYLYRAKKLAPTNSKILQAIYLSCLDLNDVKSANDWLNLSNNLSQQFSSDLCWQWVNLDINSLFTYVQFETDILLSVEASFRSTVTSTILAEGDWFEKEMEFWRNWIKPGMTVIDVGANVGVYTFSAAKRVGSTGKVLAIEPFSGCVHNLQETCRINGFDWVKVCAGAASDRYRTARLSRSTASELNELVANSVNTSMESGTFGEVACFTLDSLIEPENLSNVDILKINSEGHELAVLMGAQRILSEFKPIILYENIAESHGSNLPVADYLINQGYNLFHYQSYLQELIPLEDLYNLREHLNVIALPGLKSHHRELTFNKEEIEIEQKLSYNNIYSNKNKTLYCGRNDGFFSNCTTTLWGLIDLYRQGIIPESIDFSNGFNNYKNQEQLDNKTNLYPFLFCVDNSQKIKEGFNLLKQDHHGHYKDYDFNRYNLFIHKYFNLSKDILKIQKSLIKKYNIDFSKTISICYRGTDKSTEVRLADANSYLTISERLLIQNPDFKILIQTDQQQVRDLFIKYFDNKCFFLEEMPVTEKNIALHRDLKRFDLNGYEFGKVLLAVTNLLSKCHFIVNHTGNMASWICLFRGNADGVFQFNREGQIVFPIDYNLDNYKCK